MTRGLLRLALSVSVAGTLAASDPVPLGFKPIRKNDAVVRIWGGPRMKSLVDQWSQGLLRATPPLAVEPRLTATGLAMPGLYSGAADVALFGRDTNTTDNDGFAHVIGYPALPIEVATGSLDRPGASCALALFVARDNPLRSLSLAQVDAIFGEEGRRGLPHIRTWDQLGIEGPLAGRPIRLFGYNPRSGPGVFFRRVALKGSEKMAWERYQEFEDQNATTTGLRAGAQAVASLRGEPGGIAVGTPADLGPDVRILAIQADGSSEAVLPTRQTLISRTYAFTRPVFVCVDLPPGGALAPKVRRFLEHVLSDEGQREVEATGEFLPLNPMIAERERGKLR